VGRDDPFIDDRGTATWFRSVLLPLVALIVAVAIVCGLVFGGVLRGERTYDGTVGEPTTAPTVLIEP
jgi:hypothetical protein